MKTAAAGASVLLPAWWFMCWLVCLRYDGMAFTDSAVSWCCLALLNHY